MPTRGEVIHRSTISFSTKDTTRYGLRADYLLKQDRKTGCPPSANRTATTATEYAQSTSYTATVMWTEGTAPTITLLSAIEGGATTTTTIIAEAVVVAVVVIAEVASTTLNALTTRGTPTKTIRHSAGISSIGIPSQLDMITPDLPAATTETARLTIPISLPNGAI